jgi:hypothetical protein
LHQPTAVVEKGNGGRRWEAKYCRHSGCPWL